MILRALAALSVLTAALAVAQPAAAWSEAAHRAVAELAYERLTPRAKAAVDGLIARSAVAGEPSCPVASLGDAAAYVDCVDGVRRFNDLRKLHYEERPYCGVPDPADYCKDGECVSEAVKRAAAVLASPLSAPDERLFALEQLANFMADMHQPFQMIDNGDDRGDDIRVSLPGSSDRRLNLHNVWEDVLPAVAIGSGELGPQFLAPLADANEGAWGSGTVDGWAEETYVLAKALYGRLPEPPTCRRDPRGTPALDREYVASGVRTVREQLAKAAVRLSAVLNATLG